MNPETPPDGAHRECFGRLPMVRPISVTAEDEREFQVAMEQYKRQSGRAFPTWSEILEVLRSLGYEKRIWRPVEAWAPLPSSTISAGFAGDDQSGMIGWFATVETPVGP
jgi:hypothetical protein